MIVNAAVCKSKYKHVIKSASIDNAEDSIVLNFRFFGKTSLQYLLHISFRVKILGSFNNWNIDRTFWITNHMNGLVCRSPHAYFLQLNHAPCTYNNCPSTVHFGSNVHKRFC